MIDTFVTFITLMFAKDLPGEDVSAGYIRNLATELVESGYTLGQLNEDQGLFWKLDHRFQAYSQPAPFGA